MNSYATVLSIAGVDPSGGAGIFADFRSIEAAGARALGAVTALTVQTEDSFSSYEPTDIEMLRSTVRSMLKAFPGAAVKTGMLPTPGIVEAVAELLDELSPGTVVIDPVFIASVGARLVSEPAEAAIKTHLVQRATLLTPNMHEAAALTGMKVEDIDTMETAAAALRDMGAAAVVVTGGHLSGGEAVDVLLTGDGLSHIKAQRKKGSVHGTGCSFASSTAAYLAAGNDLENSINKAKGYIASLFSQQRWRASE